MSSQPTNANAAHEAKRHLLTATAAWATFRTAMAKVAHDTTQERERADKERVDRVIDRQRIHGH